MNIMQINTILYKLNNSGGRIIVTEAENCVKD